MCVDFRNLYRTSDKDNYPLMSMEKILQTISRTIKFSLLYGFLIYNQVLIVDPSRLKTMFCTKWGSFSFHRMSFGLVNTGATFQREMEIAFRELIG